MSETSLRVLVVDDEPAIRRFLRTTLAAHGYTIFEAATGQEALAEVVLKRPDLLILDLGLPDIDGYEVARRVRANEQQTRKRTPIIAITANALKGDADKALVAGCDLYMAKPINIRELWSRIDGFFAAPG